MSSRVRTMTPTRMPLRADEEMGKKDDDHRPSDQARFLPSWRRASTRPRRIILAVIVLVLFYEFFKHMPTDLGPAAKRYNHAVAQSREDSIAKLVHSDIPDVSKPSVVSSVKEAEPNQEQETYDGKIKFYELARSLPSDKNSRKVASRAVVFVGSHLRSVSDLLPLACRMASEQLNYVHFVLAGKEEVSIEGIKEVNGIRDNECPLTWHGMIWKIMTLEDIY